MPPNYIEALSRLQNTVTPVPGDKITAIIESELGAPISELFESFDCDPLAAASMAQVHRAILPDGSEVAVKVQRPGSRQRIEIDIEILHEVARFANKFPNSNSLQHLRSTVNTRHGVYLRSALSMVDNLLK